MERFITSMSFFFRVFCFFYEKSSSKWLEVSLSIIYLDFTLLQFIMESFNFFQCVFLFFPSCCIMLHDGFTALAYCSGIEISFPSSFSNIIQSIRKNIQELDWKICCVGKNFYILLHMVFNRQCKFLKKCENILLTKFPNFSFSFWLHKKN